MNTNQIKCFLALAETMNFTKAAERLYLTQPGLSRQIVSLEQELNTQLFIRNQKGVRLTPAGALLASELGDIHESSQRLIERVKTVGHGYTGVLSIGLLEGQWMGADLTNVFRTFMKTYPDIDLRVCHGSFGELRHLLSEGKIDAAFTLKFDIADTDGVMSEMYDRDTAVFAVSRHLPLGQKENIAFEDLLQETFLVMSPEDCRAGYDLMQHHFKQSGAHPAEIRYAPNLATMMLWIEVGLGVGIINHRSSIASNPDVRLVEEVPLEDASTCFVWRKDNPNPAVTLFLEILRRS